MRTPREQARLDALLAGKVAGPPVSCLPSRSANNQITIDNNTIAFRDRNRVYVNNLSSGCSNLSGTYALVVRTTGTGLCRGDIAELADLSSGISVGGCVLGDFIPYTMPRG
jgi:hypothetical protein